MDLYQLRNQPRIVGTRRVIGIGSAAIDITNAVRMDQLFAPPLERLPHGTLLLMSNNDGDEVLFMKHGDVGDGIISMGRVKDLRRATSFNERMQIAMSHDPIREADPQAVVITAKTPADLRKGVESEADIAKKYSGV
jgi:hypothetical protein